MTMTATEETQALRGYLAEAQRFYTAGNATEHTYRAALQRLLEALNDKIRATNEPKRIACGAPDYVITRDEKSGPRTIGWVEAKDIGVSLDETERSEQIKDRYLPNLSNFILTDYLEFRWYVDGKQRMRARLATADRAARRLTWDAEGAAQVAELLRTMLGRAAQPITSPDDLARRMAALAHMIRDVALRTLRSADDPDAALVKSAREALAGLYEAFKLTLIHDLSDEAFADMFAQTLAYGFFAARYNHGGGRPFTRQDAARDIPRSNPFLRRLFAMIETPDLADAPYIGFVDDLAALLADAPLTDILRDFGKRTRAEDPIVHFYEPFLQAYDRKLRELRGVYYTPDPVVSYITRSVEELLRRDFGVSEGLADGRVVTLDPACGTGTFLASVITNIRERFHTANNAGAWAGYVRERLLPRVFGFELLMAPYAMAHLRLGMQLSGLDLPEEERARWAFQPGEQDRLGVFLTNTLEEAALASERLPLGRFITEEADAAAKIKRDKPVMVVLGNPPYSGHSANNGPWISALLRGEDLTNSQGTTLLDRGKGAKTDDYFSVAGPALGERNPKWLNDDYVKFIRFAQWRIERTGHGVLAFVTNHGYLDNPTFRGMRQSLMRTFDEIYVLDLHGNSKKKERTPDGGPDQNVFDIQQGVAISIFVRRPGAATGDRHARVSHAHLWGERTGKYDWLAASDVFKTEWTEVAPTSPMYWFMPVNASLSEEYGAYRSLNLAMPVSNLGLNSHRDAFAVGFESETLRRRLLDLTSSAISDDAIRQRYSLEDTLDFSLTTARKALRQVSDISSIVQSCVYRPFDWRYVIYHSDVLDRSRPDLNQHIVGHTNLALVTTRQTREPFGVLSVNKICGQHKIVATYDGSSVFPLYLYPDPASKSLWTDAEPSTAPGGRRANLAPDFIRDFSARLGLAWVADGRGDRVVTFGPEDVFSYLYAIFHSPSYRERYADFLKSDFPRVPLTRDADLFRALCALGDRLVALHLMEATAAGQPSFPVGGDNRIEAPSYHEPDRASGQPGRVKINKEQYFEGVAPEVWAFHIGGYQVAEKWLKDRKGRTLTYADIEHYQQTIAALAETMALMERVDEAIEERGGWPLDAPTTP